MEQARINHDEYRKKKLLNLEGKIADYDEKFNKQNAGKHDKAVKPYTNKNYISKEKRVDIFTYNEVMAEAIRKRFFPESELREFVDSENCYGFQKIYCEQPSRLARWLNRYVIPNNVFSGISPMSMISVSGGYEIRCSADGAFLKVVQSDLEKSASNSPDALGFMD